MAALTKDRNTQIRAGGSTRTRVGKAAASAVIYHGALIAKNATGFLIPASDAAAIKVVGIAQGKVDNTGGADGAKDVTFITGVEAKFVNAAGAIVQAGCHALCYVADDQSVSTAAAMTNDVVAGLVAEFTTTEVWVFVDEVIGATA